MPEGWKKPKYSRPKRRTSSTKKPFLVLLVIACLIAAAWTGYLLFTNIIEPVVGTIILVVNIGVLIWNISVLRKYRVGTGTVISIFLTIAIIGATVGAFGGIKPLSAAKAEVVAWFQDLGSKIPTSEYPAEEEKPEEQPVELYWAASMMWPERTIMLKTIQYWEGNSPREIKFKATKAPWIVNGGYTPTSRITSSFNIMVWKEEGSYRMGTFTFEHTWGPFKGVHGAIIEETGDFIIEVKATGCEWWVKVGVE